MADYHKNTGHSVDQNLLLRMSRLEQEVAALRANKLVTVDRIAPSTFPAVEGQVAVRSSTEQFMHYSNGHWRVTAGLAWAWTTGVATVPAGIDTSNASNTWATLSMHSTSDGSTFSIVSDTVTDSSGTHSVNVLQCPAGTYLVVGEVAEFSSAPLNDRWFWHTGSKITGLGWNGEPVPPGYSHTDTWLTPASAAFNPNIQSGTLTGAHPITVNNVSGGNGYLNYQVLNYATTTLTTGSDYFFVLALDGVGNTKTVS